MSEINFISQLKQLKKDLPSMSHKEKLEHLWTYYKWLIPVVLVVIIGLSILLSCITNLSSVTMIGGITVNVSLSEEGQDYLQDDYWEYLGLTSKRQQVVLADTAMEGLLTSTNYADDYYTLQSLLALCVNKELDYMILDQTGVELLMKHDVFLDLSKVYTQEELDALGDMVSYSESAETGEVFPAVLDITGTAFIQDNVAADKTIYFGFVTNSPRVEEAKALFQYLMDWKEI